MSFPNLSMNFCWSALDSASAFLSACITDAPLKILRLSSAMLLPPSWRGFSAAVKGLVAIPFFLQYSIAALLSVLTTRSLLQFLNIGPSPKSPFPKLETLFGIVTDLRFRQSWKAPQRISVTLSGMIIDFRFSHLLKALSNIFLIPWCIVTDSSEEHPKKADAPISVTLSGIAIDFKDVYAKKPPGIALMPFGNVTDSKEWHPENTDLPSFFTLSGIAMDSNDVQ